jgi:hypothetical protein
MRADRPLVGAVISLGWGLGLIIGYCKGATNFSAAYPLSGSLLHLDLTTTGPGVLGGVALIALGVVLLLWAFVAALGSMFSSRLDREEREEHFQGYSVAPDDSRSLTPRRGWVDDVAAKPEPQPDEREVRARSSGRTQF